MRRTDTIRDMLLLMLLGAIVVALPLALVVYDHQVWQERIPPEAKVFTLAGHAQRGWILGDVHAYEAATAWEASPPVERPVLEVSKGDLVVLKLTSSDVVHGFSLKDFGIFVNDGIQPGKPVLIRFRADRAGRFTFSCNAICGAQHERMQGTLVVRA